MTRKQALLQAINILSKKHEFEEITQKLQELIDENLTPTWTKKAIIDAIKNYAIEHDDILPHTKNLTKENNLPSNTVIYNKFGTSSIEAFYKEYFPGYKQKKNSSPYTHKHENYFIEVFKQNYESIILETNSRYINKQTYNKKRKLGTPVAETIIRNLSSCNSYNDLLILCGYKRKLGEIEPILNVSYNDDVQRNEDILSIIK